MAAATTAAEATSAGCYRAIGVAVAAAVAKVCSQKKKKTAKHRDE